MGVPQIITTFEPELIQIISKSLDNHQIPEPHMNPKTHLLVRATISGYKKNWNAGQFDKVKLMVNFLPAFVIKVKRIFSASGIGRQRDGNIRGVHVSHDTSFEQRFVKP